MSAEDWVVTVFNWNSEGIPGAATHWRVTGATTPLGALETAYREAAEQSAVFVSPEQRVVDAARGVVVGAFALFSLPGSSTLVAPGAFAELRTALAELDAARGGDRGGTGPDPRGGQ